jgi:hypothetical protein
MRRRTGERRPKGRAAVSEESSAGEQGIAAPGGEPVQAPAPRSRWLSRLPWLRRTSLRVRIAAAVVAAAVIAGIVFVAVSSSSPPPNYAGLPAPCAGVSLASLTTLLPDATGTRQSEPTGSGFEGDSCKWLSTADRQDRTLEADAVLFTSSSAIGDARASYSDTLSLLGCHCARTSVSARSVTGLGDKATALFVTPGPGAEDLSDSADAIPGVTLWVLSRNAEILLNYNVTAAATGTSLAAPADAAQLTGMVSMARGILAALAHPTAVSPGTLARVSAEPHYAGSRDPCRLTSTATLATYLPGATVTPPPTKGGTPGPAGSRISFCSWGAGNASIFLNLTFFPDAASAEQTFFSDAQGLGQGAPTQTVSGAVRLTDLGEQAAAAFEDRSGTHGVEILVWSGNAEIDYWYTGPSPKSPDRATLLAGGIAMARGALAALASPSASSYLTGPVYASPRDACTLIKASTLARYVPGASAEQPSSSASGNSQLSNCGWGASNGSLYLSVTIYTDDDNALGGYEFDIQAARQNQGGTTFAGAQPVGDLGEQATAIFETFGGNPDVDVYVVSGNAEIDMSISDLPFSPTLSRAEKLAADVAMARDVLADLPR